MSDANIIYLRKWYEKTDAGGASGGRFSFFEFALMLVIPGALLILLAALLLTRST